MKLLAAFSAGLLFVMLGVAAVAHSQEPNDGAKPAAAPATSAPHPQAAAPAPHPQAAPAKPVPHPQVQPVAHPPAPHSQKSPEPRPQQEPVVHPAAPNPHEARPPEQHEHHEAAPVKQEAHPPEPQNRAATPHPVPAPRPQPAARPAAEPPRTAQQRYPAPSPEQQRDWDRHRAENWQAEHHTWQQRGGYRGYRVPEARYQAYFGPPHVFRIYENPVAFYQGYPRFQYGTYWVQVIDPWPNYWGSNWFYTDPVYVAYLNDGYYLIDTLHPDVPLAVEIFG